MALVAAVIALTIRDQDAGVHYAGGRAIEPDERGSADDMADPPPTPC